MALNLHVCSAHLRILLLETRKLNLLQCHGLGNFRSEHLLLVLESIAQQDL